MLRVHRADLTQQAADGPINTHDDCQQDSRVIAHGPQFAKDLLLPAREIFQINHEFVAHPLMIGHEPRIRQHSW